MSDPVTVFCDSAQCSERFTSVTESGVAAYLDLRAAGWETFRGPSRWWVHYCPAHVTKSYGQDRGHDDRAGGLS